MVSKYLHATVLPHIAGILAAGSMLLLCFGVGKPTGLAQIPGRKAVTWWSMSLGDWPCSRRQKNVSMESATYGVIPQSRACSVHHECEDAVPRKQASMLSAG